MKSPEDVLFTKIATAVRDAVNPIFITGEHVPAPASFPAVSIVEADNYVYNRTSTNVTLEHDVQVMYEVNVYSNRTKGKKAEAKSIAALIDEQFAKYGFRRMFLRPIQNMNDATIYRMTGRYSGVVGVDADGNFIVYNNRR